MEQGGTFVSTSIQICIESSSLDLAANGDGPGGVDDLFGVIPNDLHLLGITVDSFVIAIGNPLLLFC